jgi:subtilisin family serine protease
MSDGTHWAVDHGAKVINYSAGGSDSTTKHDAVIYAHGHGVLFVAAFGNDGVVNPPAGYPGRYDEALGVGAVTRTKNRAYYSNWGSQLDVVAPGGDTTTPGGEADGIIQNTFEPEGSYTNFGYHGWMGTSMATPHVSGLAALLWSQGTYSTRQAVFDRITGTCEDLGAAGYDNTFGWGLINANAALPAAPSLLWAGTTGYTTDGVDPNSGMPGATFTFEVKYRDSAGIAPTTHRVEIQRGTARPTSVILTALKGGSYTTGKIYKGTQVLTTKAVYQYRFRFEHGTGWATGIPASYKSGPTVK